MLNEAEVHNADFSGSACGRNMRGKLQSTIGFEGRFYAARQRRFREEFMVVGRSPGSQDFAANRQEKLGLAQAAPSSKSFERLVFLTRLFSERPAMPGRRTRERLLRRYMLEGWKSAQHLMWPTLPNIAYCWRVCDSSPNPLRVFSKLHSFSSNPS